MSEGRENSVSPMKGEMSSSGGLLGHKVHALWFMWPQQSGFSGSKGKENIVNWLWVSSLKDFIIPLSVGFCINGSLVQGHLETMTISSSLSGKG